MCGAQHLTLEEIVNILNTYPNYGFWRRAADPQTRVLARAIKSRRFGGLDRDPAGARLRGGGPSATAKDVRCSTWFAPQKRFLALTRASSFVVWGHSPDVNRLFANGSAVAFDPAPNAGHGFVAFKASDAAVAWIAARFAGL
jgi:hypothetical protein